MSLTKERLDELLERFKDLSIVLIGDLFLDRWYEIDPLLDEPSLETGKPAHQVVGKRSAPGAGGNVLNDIAALGTGHVTAVSFVGDDGDGYELLSHLKRIGIDVSKVLVSDRVVTPSYIKPLWPEEGERFDIKNFRKTPADIEDALIGSLESLMKEKPDAVVILDQVCEAGCGVVTEKVRNAVAGIAEANPGTVFIADSRQFPGEFRNVILKCNNHEALEISGGRKDDDTFSPDEVFSAMHRLEELTGRQVIVTCNKYGIAVRDGNESRLVPAVRQNGPIDVCGAGDAATAGFAAALSAGASMQEAAAVANLCSGVCVRKIDQTGSASPLEIQAIFREY